MAKTASVEIYRAKNQQWGWRVRAKNSRIVCVGGETFTRKSSAVRASKRAFRTFAVTDGWCAV